jgi:hypothetical protein
MRLGMNPYIMNVLDLAPALTHRSFIQF